MSAIVDVLQQAAAWRDEGRGVALATVVRKGAVLAHTLRLGGAAPKKGVRASMPSMASMRRDAGAVRAFRAMRVGLLLSCLEGQPAARLEQGSRAVNGRVRALGGTVVKELRCAHTVAAVAAGLGELLALEPDLVLVLGASAIVDREDDTQTREGH